MGDFDLDSLVGCDVIWGDELFYIESVLHSRMGHNYNRDTGNIHTYFYPAVFFLYKDGKYVRTVDADECEVLTYGNGE